MKHRLERVKELLKRELGDLIGREFTFDHLVTIQEVDITPDLKQAHVYVSVFGGSERDANAAIAKLHSRRKELQALVSRRVILKYTPQLHFKLDKAVERGDRVIDILQSLNLPEEPADSPAEGDPSDDEPTA